MGRCAVLRRLAEPGRRPGPVPSPRLASGVGRVAWVGLFFHPARLELGLPFLALEHRDLITQLLDQFALSQRLLNQLLDLLQQLLNQRRTVRFSDHRKRISVSHTRKISQSRSKVR